MTKLMWIVTKDRVRAAPSVRQRSSRSVGGEYLVMRSSVFVLRDQVLDKPRQIRRFSRRTKVQLQW
jgi:hypothetical protein